MPLADQNDGRSHGPAGFAPTRWSLVLGAADPASPAYRASLAELYESYWQPLYAFLRRRGCGPAEAEDHAQAFFAHLLESQHLRRADPERGRFRSFLLTCLKHFVANERERAAARKRGGGRPVLALNFGAAERAYAAVAAIEPSHDLTPEREFDRRWALTVLGRATDRLRREWERDGKARQFELLSPCLGERGSYEDIAPKLGVTPGAARVAAHRMRGRYRELLREEVAQTVADPAAVDAEIRDLLQALGR